MHRNSYIFFRSLSIKSISVGETNKKNRFLSITTINIQLKWFYALYPLKNLVRKLFDGYTYSERLDGVKTRILSKQNENKIIFVLLNKKLKKILTIQINLLIYSMSSRELPYMFVIQLNIYEGSPTVTLYIYIHSKNIQ